MVALAIFNSWSFLVLAHLAAVLEFLWLLFFFDQAKSADGGVRLLPRLRADVFRNFCSSNLLQYLNGARILLSFKYYAKSGHLDAEHSETGSFDNWVVWEPRCSE